MKRPPPSLFAALCGFLLLVSSAFAQTGFTVDTTSREEVRNFYRTVYAASENAVIGWTGDVDLAIAGTTNQSFKDAVALRVNYYRALAGVPAEITFFDAFNVQAQDAALMMSANDTLDHFPPTTWSCYTASGAYAAARSNLALGTNGPDAIDGYIEDFGSTNDVAGHRRWVLFPQTETMGTGDVPSNGLYQAANALWVIDPNAAGAARPAVRDEFVAWPPPGYVPYSQVFARWSFSYPNADFSGATVSMTRDGLTLNVFLEWVTDGYGENTLVWVPDDLDSSVPFTPTAPLADTTTHVTVSNVVINGVAKNFSYDVTIFDPAKAGADTVLTTITGTATPLAGVANSYSFPAVRKATAYQWQSRPQTTFTAVEGAENGLTNVTANVPAGYNPISTTVHPVGLASFHLTHPGLVDQFLTLNRTLVPTATSQLSFLSRLGYATSGQTAHVQISTDDGATWTDVYSQVGSDSAGETSFTTRTVSLASYAGKAVQLRFWYAYELGQPGYNQTLDSVGWFIDQIAISNADELGTATVTDIPSGTQFVLQPTQAGRFALQVRPQFYGLYFTEWGPIKTVTVAAPPVISPQLTNKTVNINSNVTLTIGVTGTAPLTIEWLKDNSVIPNQNGTSLLLQNVALTATGTYTARVTDGNGAIATSSAVITVAPKPSITTPPSDVTVDADGTAVFQVTATSITTLSYQWFRNNVPLANATAAKLTLNLVQPSQQGTYKVRVTNGSGFVESADVQLTVTIPTPIATTNAATAITSTGAVLNGSIDVHGQTVSAFFEYSTGGNTVATPTQSVSASGAVQATLSNLASATQFSAKLVLVTLGNARIEGSAVNFTTLPPQVTLTISVSPPGAGIVTGATSGTKHTAGELISLDATATAGFAFAGWSGDVSANNGPLAFNIAANSTVIANFVTDPRAAAAGKYVGLVLANPRTHASSGLVSVTLTKAGGFSGSVTVGGVKFPVKGTLGSDGIGRFKNNATTLTLVRKAPAPPLTFALRLGLSPAGPLEQLVGTVTEAGGFSSAFAADRALFTAKKPAVSPFANVGADVLGMHTARLSRMAGAPVNSPIGDGFATLTVKPDGTAVLAGLLADGTPISASAPLARNGGWPLLVVTDRGAGSLVGAVTFHGGAGSAVDGTPSWFRPQRANDALFGSGWIAGATLDLTGGGYVAPKAGVDWALSGLAGSNGVANLDFTSSATAQHTKQALAVALKNHAITLTQPLTIPSLKPTLNAATGLLKGSITLPGATKATPFKALLLQGEDAARGFYVAPAESGAVRFQPGP